MTRIAALVLAGGKASPEMRAAAGPDAPENRALIAVGPENRTMLAYATDALRAGLPEGSRLLVAGAGDGFGDETVPGGESLVDTLLNGVAALRAGEDRLLVATADIPFLTGSAVADFLRRCAARPDAKFHWPIVPADLCAQRFPGMRRTTLRIAEGSFTGGNLALLDPGFLLRNEATIRAAYAKRKDVVALARLLGPSLLVRLAISRVNPKALTIPILEGAVSRLLGGPSVHAVPCPLPEIAADVDRPEDIAFARRFLKDH